MMSITVLVGNPKQHSRTRDAAVSVARRLSAEPPSIIDLAEHTDALVLWDDPKISELKETVLRSHIVIVASPTFKASFTGLLKLFLDRFDRDEWSRVVAIPLMTGAAAQHALAPEVHLKPVLAELGAATPTRALYVVMNDLVDEQVDRWWTEQSEKLPTTKG